jgi:hypothetical protein
MTLPGATPLRRLCNRPLQSARFLRITTTSGECATDDRGVVVPRCVVQVPHRGLRVGVAHLPPDVGLRNHAGPERVTEVVEPQRPKFDGAESGVATPRRPGDGR